MRRVGKWLRGAARFLLRVPARIWWVFRHGPGWLWSRVAGRAGYALGTAWLGALVVVSYMMVVQAMRVAEAMPPVPEIADGPHMPVLDKPLDEALKELQDNVAKRRKRMAAMSYIEMPDSELGYEVRDGTGKNIKATLASMKDIQKIRRGILEGELDVNAILEKDAETTDQVDVLTEVRAEPEGPDITDWIGKNQHLTSSTGDIAPVTPPPPEKQPKKKRKKSDVQAPGAAFEINGLGEAAVLGAQGKDVPTPEEEKKLEEKQAEKEEVKEPERPQRPKGPSHGELLSLRNIFAVVGDKGFLDVEIADGRYVLLLPKNLVRPDGTLLEGAEPFVKRLVSVLNSIPSHGYLIVGNLLSKERGQAARDAWEASAQRALLLSRILMEEGLTSKRVSVAGFSKATMTKGRQVPSIRPRIVLIPEQPSSVRRN